jgi:hypothetical protein
VRVCLMLPRVFTPSLPVRERERKRNEGREGERCRICPELSFLFLKEMTGALAPFSYLVLKIYFGYSVGWKFTNF